MVDDLKKEKGGFEFKKLEYEPIKTPDLLNDEEDPQPADERPVVTLYGSPAPTYLKVTPLNKKGKLDINYAAKLTEAGKTAILNSNANDSFKKVIRETPTEEDKEKKS